MDHRDEIGEFGTFISSLPEYEVDLEKMEATFVESEPDTDTPPPREKSRMEVGGEATDQSISDWTDKAVQLLQEKKVFVVSGGCTPSFFRHFPLNKAVRKFVGGNIRIDPGYNYLGNTGRSPAKVALEMSINIPFIIMGKHGNRHPHLPIKVLVNQNKVPTPGEHKDYPHVSYDYTMETFQVVIGDYHVKQKDEEGLGFFAKALCRWGKGWSPFGTGRLNFSVAGRYLNKVVNGEFTTDQQKDTLRNWLSANDVEVEENYWVVDGPVMAKARKELGDWVLRHLDLGPLVHTLSLKWEVCGTCGGKGRHVNPSIDHNGITEREMYEDHDFADDYFDGVYDVRCYECGGRTTSVVIDESRTSKESLKAADEWIQEECSYRSLVDSERRMGC